MPVSSEADERVQRFYGILPKEVKGEVKTPRMVKQASKKNSKVKRNGSGEEDSESLEVRIRSFYAAAFLFDPLTLVSYPTR